MSKWYEKAAFYHIYPLGLCGSAKENDRVTQESHFDKLQEWVMHIKEIGCNAIYIGPLFESGVHGYDTFDYKQVDRRLGTNEDFKNYVQSCHNLGIRVIVDGVFNHTGRGFFAFEDIKGKRESSVYKDWYSKVNLGGNNSYNDGFSYENWAGHDMLPRLNQQNPEVKAYILDVIRFWVSEFDIDGIRLDAADVLDFQFMKEMRQTADVVKEDFWLMGEVIHGDYSRWANANMLHSVTNYELHKAFFSGHNDHNYFEIAHSVKRILGLCPNICLYNFLDNHDVERIYNKLINKDHLYPLYMLLYTLPGIPSIYYGSEFAIEGTKQKGSDDSLRPNISLEDFKADETYKPEYAKLIEWIQILGNFKENYEELSSGEYKELLLTNRQYIFGRYLEKSGMIIAVNNDTNSASVSFSIGKDVEKLVDLYTKKEIVIQNGKITLDLNENSGTILYFNG